MKRWQVRASALIIMGITIVRADIVRAYVPPAVVSVTDSITTPLDATSSRTDSTNHTVKLPSTLQSGWLLLALVTFDGTPTVTPPSGWSRLSTASGGTAVKGEVYYHIVTSGNESRTSVTFTTDVAEQGAAQVYAVANWSGSVSDIAISTPVVSTAAAPDGTTADPPALTPSWGGNNTIWIAATHTSSSRTVTSGPSGYSPVYATRSGEDNTSGQMSSSYKITSSATEDPAIYTFSSTGVTSVTETIAISPGPQVDKVKFLEQLTFTQSSQTLYTPMYVSKPTTVTDTSVRRVVVISHGSSLNVEDYFNYGRDAVQGASDIAIVAPMFDELDGNPAVGQLFWSSVWRECGRSSSTLAFRVSSCAVLDELKSRLKTAFPNLESIVYSGFSAGGQLMNRYAYTSTSAPDTSVRYITGGPSSYLYLSNERPNQSGGFSVPDVTACPTYNEYKYGLDALSGTSYMNAIGAAALTSNYQKNRVTYMVGSLDNDPTDTSADLTCSAMYQGDHRLDRMNKFISYADYFYGNYTGDIIERQKMEVVDGVAHSASGVFNSAKGKAAFLQGHTYTAPNNLVQAKTTGEVLATGGSIGSDMKLDFSFKSAIKDPLSAGSTFYIELRKTTDRLRAPFNPSLNACDVSVTWKDCGSKVWSVAAQSDGGVATNLTANAIIGGFDADAQYRWQVVVCDSAMICSDWSKQSSATSFVVTAPQSVDVQVVDGGGASVVPLYVLTGGIRQSTCQQSTGLFGTSTQRIRVTSTLTDTAWALSVAPTLGASAVWKNTTTADAYDINDPNGCTDSADSDGFGGSLALNGAHSSIAAQSGCSISGVTSSGGASFSENNTDQITLANGSAGSQSGCYWDFYGYEMTQNIPANQPAGQYTVDMTVSVVAQ